MRITDWNRVATDDLAARIGVIQSHRYLGPIQLIVTGGVGQTWTARAVANFSPDYPERESVHPTEAEARRAAENLAVDLARDLYTSIAAKVILEHAGRRRDFSTAATPVGAAS